MEGNEENGKCFSVAWSVSAKLCDSCKSEPAVLFCRSDTAFLCIGCDSKIHNSNNLAYRHDRVWMCEVCEQAPASVTCKADAALLCVTCDADIHSANPLASRHERFPVVPFYDSASASAVKHNAVNLLVNGDHVEESDTCQGEAEAASWLQPSANPKTIANPVVKSDGYFFSDEVDPYLNLEYASQFQPQVDGGGADSVVPVHTKVSTPTLPIPSDNFLEIDFRLSKPLPYSYSAAESISHSVSSSSLDVGVVPDNSMADMSDPIYGNMKMGSDTGNTATQLSSVDREARVLRYREKRKNRKFEKTIRYASRKAYAETRPRIKGRFAKRTTEIETDVGRIYLSPADLMTETGYGVVPSF
eukprot:TRINITY_DN83_c0_g2_i1.p1 TRINITY_DN83_c0_g2~~TRINITY_DN83_c0_g2_i1.p1  ORF type:complete len:369 (+),score=3.24 TRINITY_DN83_c0_g2_i1:33-1109(+)